MRNLTTTMLLKKLINNSKKIKKIKKIIIRGLTSNSNYVRKGFIFFALKGHKFNGEKFIKDAIRKVGEREIPSQSIGKHVMNHLKELDQVAYVRYASVYQNFQDIEDFVDEVSELSKK